jgi:NAD(P)-dependent dehydrogenase (short-subunit alcohol dehydrogenase family)
MLPIEDKGMIITGVGGGIGNATARRLAEHGARVVLADRNLAAAERAAEEIERKGGTAGHPAPHLRKRHLMPLFGQEGQEAGSTSQRRL